MSVEDILVAHTDYLGERTLVIDMGQMAAPGKIGAEANAQKSGIVLKTFKYVSSLALLKDNNQEIKKLHEACLHYMKPPPQAEWGKEESLLDA